MLGTGWCYTKAPLLPNLVSITPAPWAVPVGGYFYAKPPGNGEPPAEQGNPKGCREDAQAGAKILQRKEVKELRLLSLSKGQGGYLIAMSKYLPGRKYRLLEYL